MAACQGAAQYRVRMPLAQVRSASQSLTCAELTRLTRSVFSSTRSWSYSHSEFEAILSRNAYASRRAASRDALIGRISSAYAFSTVATCCTASPNARALVSTGSITVNSCPDSGAS